MKTSILKAVQISSATMVIFSVLAFYALPVRAQSAQSTSTTSDIIGASNASNFQNAGFQQSGGSAATTAGGSASALHQIATGPLTVTGAPATNTASQSTATPSKLGFTIIFVASAVGLVLVYLYTKRAKKAEGPKEEAFVKEVIAETIDEAKPAKKPKKDTTKKKKKNKKHHR